MLLFLFGLRPNRIQPDLFLDRLFTLELFYILINYCLVIDFIFTKGSNLIGVKRRCRNQRIDSLHLRQWFFPRESGQILFNLNCLLFRACKYLCNLLTNWFLFVNLILSRSSQRAHSDGPFREFFFSSNLLLLIQLHFFLFHLLLRPHNLRMVIKFPSFRSSLSTLRFLCQNLFRRP